MCTTVNAACNKVDPSSCNGKLFVAYLREHLPQVEKALAAAAATPLSANTEVAVPAHDLNAYLYEPLARFTAGGGKRVRPVLALLGAEAVGGQTKDAFSTGVAIELFQSAALIHDDIADAGELRRGNPCLHRSEGTGLAINAGDLALTQVFEFVLNDEFLSSERKASVLKELVFMERRTLEGQALDLGWARDGRWDISSDDYFYMIEGKTAWYTVASPLFIGAIAAGASRETAQGLIGFGLPAGLAFQLQDDVLNLVGNAEAQGKDFRSDITEGKRTLAVVWALEHLERDLHNELIQLLEAKTNDATALARAVELIELGGGIEACQKLAVEKANEARNVAVSLEERGVITEHAAQLMCSMTDFFINRSA